MQPQVMVPPTVPPKKKSRKGLFIIIGIVAVIVIIAIATGSHGSTSSNTNASNSGSSSTNNSSAPKTPATWQTTHTYSGNGNEKTATFTVGDDWKIRWTCNPSSFDGIDYNVIASVMNSDATPLDYGAINATCKSGNTSGETEEHQSGTVYLDIQSEGDWTFTVQELK